VHRVDIFPAVAPVLIDDMRDAHVSFFVVPARHHNPMLIPLAQSLVSMMLVIWLIAAFGLMDSLLTGIAMYGLGLYLALDMLNREIDTAVESLQASVAAGKTKHDDAMRALVEAFRPRREGRAQAYAYVEVDETPQARPLSKLYRHSSQVVQVLILSGRDAARRAQGETHASPNRMHSVLALSLCAHFEPPSPRSDFCSCLILSVQERLEREHLERRDGGM